ncbi:hypothetical protein EMIHUDRAFT_225440 [Emiliania huxleyi CCMP1516]|uniref:Uncharacterized protein n=2 Tax=Emiliania huxleyi TaxID=2903 RepID=A0A0D3KP68_EMIH1|nr:hypothetical protein EMIHUDRAFT_225440 [Emiliania huxleyi CCMP1516]EOD37553.1 hypothetical protein EMIHUDRAFT_225440 [Emiliania huxleyi CCMP1516]|eukprot:XP_005789982.1 hypothetical protein EMIHUDRAFT_225440 [Emiliania huxleyi CCMP1516]
MGGFWKDDQGDRLAAKSCCKCPKMLAIATASCAFSMMRPALSMEASSPSGQRRGTPLLLGEEDDESPPDESLDEAFEAGRSFGFTVRERFTAPTVDDPGLPYADALVSVSAALGLASLRLSGIYPQCSWLQPTEWVPHVRSLPYVLPALTHGVQLASCWTLGALAASAFERDAFCGSLGEALRRTWRGGAFASGLLLLCTQAHTYYAFDAAGLEPVLGASFEGDVRLINIANDVILDVLAQAFAITGFRIFRWYDATAGRR